MTEKQRSGEEILVSNIDRIGIVHLQGVEKYIEKHNPKICFLITPVNPHDNVLKYAEQIQALKIIISSNFQEEKKRIEIEYSDVKIITINPYQLAGRDGMIEGA